MKVDNAVVQIYTRLGCASDEPGYFEDYEVLRRPTTRERGLAELRRIRAINPSDTFRLRLEDWNTGNVEYVE